MLSCGAPLPAALRRKVVERVCPRLWDYYGATESPLSETNYRIRLFKRYASVDFAGLGIF